MKEVSQWANQLALLFIVYCFAADSCDSLPWPAGNVSLILKSQADQVFIEHSDNSDTEVQFSQCS